MPITTPNRIQSPSTTSATPFIAAAPTTAATQHPPPHAATFLPRETTLDSLNTGALETLQMTVVRGAPSCSHAPSPTVRESARFNLLLMVADQTGNAAPIAEDAARADFSNAWGSRVRDIDEVTTNLFLAGFCTEHEYMT
ncbi:hypothetical protein SORBI_3007G064700 [Sorghum bicolor]|uniref:Uncharacterized protein n=1 Tax=Sorghum bicolor TaxID=4558 RepID=A0A1B6PFZ4_SORBI|nr:hypothetical protein SORBI_3007G064700 [Sorghum bicolor]